MKHKGAGKWKSRFKEEHGKEKLSILSSDSSSVFSGAVVIKDTGKPPGFATPWSSYRKTRSPLPGRERAGSSQSAVSSGAE